VSVLLVADPLPTLDPQVDASIGLAAAALDLGEQVWVCTPEDLSAHGSRVHARAAALTLGSRHRGSDHRWQVQADWHRLGRVRTIDVAAACDLVLLRIDPPVDARYLRTTYLLDLVELAGTRVVNRPEGVRALHEKAVALHLSDLGPPTTITADPTAVRRFVAAAGTCVVKPFDGFAGRDCWLLHDDEGCLALAESATAGGTRHVIVQPYLADVARGNKRLFLLDGDVVGAVVRRPSDGDFRIGPPVAAAEVDADDRAVVRALAPLLSRHGIALAGVDVIGGRLIEVNVTCPGGMHKTDALLGTDLSGTIVRHLLGLPSSDHKLSQREEGVPA
jgi:glutathione synthase